MRGEASKFSGMGHGSYTFGPDCYLDEDADASSRLYGRVADASWEAANDIGFSCPRLKPD